MKNPTVATPRASRWFNRLLRWTYGRWLGRAYSISSEGSELFRTLRPPYVLIPNHVSLIDPFVVGSLVPDPVHWITSDGNMRSSIMRVLLSLVGSIPKSKAIPDLETVGNIVRVVRKARGVVGIFAEGQSCWNGVTQPIYPSTAKLLTLLKVPVVVPLIQGLYLSSPRWGRGQRRGRVEVKFQLALSGEECRTLGPEGILRRLESTLAHDEYAWLKARPELRFEGRNRAEGLERAYFLCPRCSSLGTIQSKGNRVACVSCGAGSRYTRRGTLEPTAGAESLGPGDLREWDTIQGLAFAKLLAERAARKDGEPLLEDPGVELFRGKRLSPLVKIRAGRLALFHDHLAFLPALRSIRGETCRQPLRFPLEQIEGIGTLKSRTLEFYIHRTYYRLNFPGPRLSARKWQAAVECLRDTATRVPPSGNFDGPKAVSVAKGGLPGHKPGRAFYP